MASTDVFLNAIRQSGRRVTDQRRIICSHLANNRTHPTPSQVFEELTSEHPEISRATVYNTLNILQELGAIVEISFGDGHTHYETNTSPHVNLVCLRCHDIVDLPVEPGLLEEQAAWRQDGFTAVTVKTDVFGFCADCRKRKRLEIQEKLRHSDGSDDVQPQRKADNTGGDR